MKTILFSAAFLVMAATPHSVFAKSSWRFESAPFTYRVVSCVINEDNGKEYLAESIIKIRGRGSFEEETTIPRIYSDEEQREFDKRQLEGETRGKNFPMTAKRTACGGRKLNIDMMVPRNEKKDPKSSLTRSWGRYVLQPDNEDAERARKIIELILELKGRDLPNVSLMIPDERILKDRYEFEKEHGCGGEFLVEWVRRYHPEVNLGDEGEEAGSEERKCRLLVPPAP